jgi:hypothetical protein
MGVDGRIALIASRQLGLVTRRQAMEAGATKAMMEHRVSMRRWRQLHRGVFLVNGAPHSFERDVLAACLAAGEGTVASCFTAAAIWELMDRSNSPIELSVPVPRRCRIKGLVIHHVQLSPKDVTVRGVVPITSPFRTLVDLAGAAKTDDGFEVAFDTALRKRLLSIPRLIKQVADLDGSRIPGVRLLRQTFESRIGFGIPMSELESHFVSLLDRYGLPQPVRQHPAKDEQKLIGRVDFYYPHRNLVIEVHGFGYHWAPSDLDRDIHRANDFVLAEIRALQFSWRDVLWRSGMVIETISRALGPLNP